MCGKSRAPAFGTFCSLDLPSTKIIDLSHTEREQAKRTEKEGGDWEALLRQRVVPNGVEYVVAHWPPPPLESIYVNNSSTQYAPLRLARLDSWAEGVWVRKTLRSLGICTGVDVPSLAYYLRDLKFSPALQNLNIWAGYPLDTRTSSNRRLLIAHTQTLL